MPVAGETLPRSAPIRATAWIRVFLGQLADPGFELFEPDRFQLREAALLVGLPQLLGPPVKQRRPDAEVRRHAGRAAPAAPPMLQRLPFVFRTVVRLSRRRFPDLGLHGFSFPLCPRPRVRQFRATSA